jgi:glycosyltransferase 2 family protein
LKKLLIAVLKFTIPLAIGLFLIWFIYKDISEENRIIIWQSFKEANYYWIALSFLLGIISHISRAMRWLLLVKPMGYHPRLSNSFFAVMIGYLANMAFPRLGEVSRCAVISKYEKIPLEKVFGTVMAERVIDMIILLLLLLVVVMTQINILWDFVNDKLLNPLIAKLSATSPLLILVLFLLIIVFAIAAFFLLQKFMKSFFIKIKALVAGFAEGFTAVIKLKNKFAFIFHTVLIWSMYFLMLYVCFFSLEATSSVSLAGVLACFVLGSIGIVAVQGGIGAYQYIITQTLLLYGIAAPIGFALGWIAWTGQVVMILFAGFLSLLLLPLMNKKQLHEQNSNNTVQNIPA